MCGRFPLATTKEKLQQQLPFVETTGDALRVSFNIAPTQPAYVLTGDFPHRLQLFGWGLVPYWAENDRNGGKLINARMEDIETKPSFKEPVRRRRCLVPADSFYEWRKEGDRKIPYRILLKNGELLLLASIWDVWQKEGREVKTFSIITAPANSDMTALHDRMPVILRGKEQQELWLHTKNLREALQLLQPLPDDLLLMYRVSEKLNSVQNNGPELQKEVQGPLTLFD
jgi:putative SOS response-associated peptidase YedK